MPRGPKGEKRPADVNARAVMIASPPPSRAVSAPPPADRFLARPHPDEPRRSEWPPASP
jgi:hypothetical protein